MSDLSDTPAAELFTRMLPLIDRVIDATIRRHRLSGADAEDFASIARLRLFDKDCAVLRRFEGRSSLSTFLTVVLNRIYIDFRIETWGKWRPSARARRRGELAINLERLVCRDRLRFEEACQKLCRGDDKSPTAADLEALLAELSRQPWRRTVNDADLDEMPSPDANVENALIQADVRRAIHALAHALLRLSPLERHLIRLRFVRRLTVVEIARRYTLDQKTLYRRFERILSTLRHELEARGISGENLDFSRCAHYALSWAALDHVKDLPVARVLAGPRRPSGSPQPAPNRDPARIVA